MAFVFELAVALLGGGQVGGEAALVGEAVLADGLGLEVAAAGEVEARTGAHGADGAAVVAPWGAVAAGPVEAGDADAD